jgi:hypothetical protein
MRLSWSSSLCKDLKLKPTDADRGEPKAVTLTFCDSIPRRFVFLEPLNVQRVLFTMMAAQPYESTV